MTNALELLKASATTGHIAGQTPLEIFFGKLAIQIKTAQEAKEGKAFNTRSTWFRKAGNEYIVRIGRNAFEIAGSKLFKAKDLDGVIELLNAAKAAIEADVKLQATIVKHSTERGQGGDKVYQ